MFGIGQKKKSKPETPTGLDFLVGCMAEVRPAKGRRDAKLNLERLIARLYQDPAFLGELRQALLSQLIGTDLSSALVESGIPMARGFWQELFGRLRHKLLPPLQDRNDFLYVLNRVFFRSNDYRWVEDIPRTVWMDFFQSLGLSLHIDDRRILRQLLQSLKTLAFQVAQLGLEKEVLLYIPEQYREENPFVEQSYLVHELEEWIIDYGKTTPPEAIAVAIDQQLAWCRECIEHIRDNHSRRGASLHQTYLLLLLANRLDRMSILVDLLDKDKTERTTGSLAEGPLLDFVHGWEVTFDKNRTAMNLGMFVDFFRMLVRNENRKNSILEFMSQSMGYLAYQISEHKGAKGSKYITSTWAEYRGMVKSAMGGGAWICLVVLVKNLLTRLPMAIFWHGFAYSINYSLGFILIEETHTTLATKQPAFTASAVASSLDTKKEAGQPNLYNLAITVARVSRSQIASFAGNLVIVFPGCWLIAWAYEKIMGVKLVSGDAAIKMLRDQHPWQSLSLLYACNTGVFLFLSGIIAGYVQNKIQYSDISLRLQTHPVLRLSMPEDRRRRLADYVEHNAGSLIGNISLGFFLGMAGFWGEIFGTHFEIRHITISAGNTSLAVYGLGFSGVDPWYLVTVVAGVLGIGFFNFLVSFSLAFFVAARSRGVRMREYPEFLGILWRYFKNSPLDFVRPRRRTEPAD